MASTTTLKLPEPLKARIAPLAEAAGKSPHAWMIEALEARVAQSEAYAAFVDEALKAEQEMLRSGEAYAADDVFAYMRDKVAGRPTKRPKPIKI
jgi:predicted transcriptional regulator